MLAGERPATIGQVFNVGSPAETSILQLARDVISLTGSSSSIQDQEHRLVFGPDFEDTIRRAPDVSKAERVLGFKAGVALDDGIRRTAGAVGRTRQPTLREQTIHAQNSEAGSINKRSA